MTARWLLEAELWAHELVSSWENGLGHHLGQQLAIGRACAWECGWVPLMEVQKAQKMGLLSEGLLASMLASVLEKRWAQVLLHTEHAVQ